MVTVPKAEEEKQWPGQILQTKKKYVLPNEAQGLQTVFKSTWKALFKKFLAEIHVWCVYMKMIPRDFSCL